jgi:hypothetical protein
MDTLNPSTPEFKWQMFRGRIIATAYYRNGDATPGVNPIKTFYGRNLRFVIISYNVCPWQAFPA